MPRKLDFNTNSKYPTVVSQKDLHKKKNVLIVPNLITEIEGVTEEIPNMNDFENDASGTERRLVSAHHTLVGLPDCFRENASCQMLFLGIIHEY